MVIRIQTFPNIALPPPLESRTKKLQFFTFNSDIKCIILHLPSTLQLNGFSENSWAGKSTLVSLRSTTGATSYMVSAPHQSIASIKLLWTTKSKVVQHQMLEQCSVWEARSCSFKKPKSLEKIIYYLCCSRVLEMAFSHIPAGRKNGIQ